MEKFVVYAILSEIVALWLKLYKDSLVSQILQELT